MRVSHVQLRDWRNYAEADVVLEPGVTLILGPNGQGKTNFVEAIGYVATLASHRVSDDAALVQRGADAAIVRLRLEHAGRQLGVELHVNRRGGNRAQISGNPAKPRDLLRALSTVQFAPEDLALIRSEPSHRRRFLDNLLVHQTPRLAGTLSDYERALRQRNTLLKSARTSRISAAQLSTLDVWDDKVAILGAEIIDARERLLAALVDPVVTAYRAVAGADHDVALSMRRSIDGAAPDDDLDTKSPAETMVNARGRVDIEQAFRAALLDHRKAELERGVTLVGPHRDDLFLSLNGLPARGFASHGESWSYALALRIASAELLRADSPLGDPVVILDDVFAELDERRRRRLAAAVSDFEQLLITAAVDDDIPEELAGRRLRVAGGIITDGTEA